MENLNAPELEILISAAETELSFLDNVQGHGQDVTPQKVAVLQLRSKLLQMHNAAASAAHEEKLKAIGKGAE